MYLKREGDTLKRESFLTRYRVVSSQRNIRYDNSRIMKELGWKSVVSVDKAIDTILEFERA